METRDAPRKWHEWIPAETLSTGSRPLRSKALVRRLYCPRMVVLHVHDTLSRCPMKLSAFFEVYVNPRHLFMSLP